MLRLAHPLDVPAHIELLFEDGIPVAVNGITMALPELTESLSTIAADHGIGSLPVAPVAPSTPVDLVLDTARQAIAAGDPHATGVVRMKLHLGEQTIVSVSPAVPQPS
jgi:hypothetical protein